MTDEIKYHNGFLSFIMNKRLSVIRHLLFLIPIALAFYPDLGQLKMPNNAIPNGGAMASSIYLHSFLIFSYTLFAIYFNILYLIPNFFFKGKYFTYVTICVLLAILFYFFEYYSAQVNLGPFRKYTTAIPKFSVTNFIRESLIPLVFFGTTTGYKVFKKWLIDVQRINELTHTQLKDELNHLKNQVNPHFLFNTLNNLHTLSQINSEKTSKMILGLSDVLRYHIYESSKEYISLSKDIEMLNHYLMLEKIRRDNFKYEIVISSDIKGVLIPPLLFITFVENALKHGVDDREPSYFTMRFNIVDKNLVFEAENSKPSIIIRNKVGGIGLKNIQRRLELLFKNNYKLEIRDSVNSYIVNLQIPI